MSNLIELDPLPLNDSNPGTPFGDLVIILKQSVLTQVAAFAEENLTREVGGIFAGKVWSDHNSRYVEICGCVPANATGTIGTLTFSTETWLKAEKDLDDKFPGCQKVGWYHTHIGCGVFLSSMDKHLHHVAFNLPWQVAMVYDPIYSEFGFFGWNDDKLEHKRFYLFQENEIYREKEISKIIKQRLNNLMTYLGTQQHSQALSQAYHSFRNSLEHYSSPTFYANEIMNDTLKTLIAASALDQKFISKLKTALSKRLGTVIRIGENAQSISNISIEAANRVTLFEQVIFYTDGGKIVSSSLDGIDKKSISIKMPEEISLLTVTDDTIYALDKKSMLHILSRNLLQKPGESHTILENAFLLPTPYDSFRDIQVYKGTIYLLLKQHIWITSLHSLENKENIQIISLNPDNLFPIDAQSMSIDEKGNVYIADVENSSLIKLSPNNSIEILSIGGGELAFGEPSVIRISKDRMYILDTLTFRIIVYEMDKTKNIWHYNWSELKQTNPVRNILLNSAGDLFFCAGLNKYKLYQIL